MSEKLQDIFEKNAEFEKETPYNFCDRWCERCRHEKQARCTLYQDEFERKITCIAHSKEPEDPELNAEIMERQYKDLEDVFEECEEEIDLENTEGPEWEKIKDHIKFVENNPLRKTAKQYHKKAHTFLENTSYKKETLKKEFIYDFETISWYYTLLPVKLQRALAGFHEPACEDEFALYDAVAQFEICKKAITQSTDALRRICMGYLSFQAQIQEMLALLNNIHSRIENMEASI